MANEEYSPKPYPLSWPPFITRRASHRRKHSNFIRHAETGNGRRRWSAAEARDEAIRQLKLLGATAIVVSTDLPVSPRGGFTREGLTPDDPAAAVWFRRSVSAPMFVISNDTFVRTACNLRAIAATIEHLRGIERVGSTTLLEQAFSGFAALPPGVTGIPPWREVLDFPEHSPTGDPRRDLDLVEQTYRRMIREAHEDVSADHERHVILNEARRRARAELGG